MDSSPLVAGEASCGGATPDEAAMLGADLATLDRGLAALPERFRNVLVMSCLDGLSHEECAAVLKCSERAVTSRVAQQVGAFALPEGSADAAFVVTLPPGAYTIKASGVGGGTGVALVEVYVVD